jgi:hypothetical protein
MIPDKKNLKIIIQVVRNALLASFEDDMENVSTISTKETMRMFLQR